MVTPTDEAGRKKFEQGLERQRELEEFLKALKPDEVSFFVRFGNELNKRRSQVRTFDDYLLSDPRSNQPWKTAEKGYVEHLSYFVNLQETLKLRKYLRSRNKPLPDLEFFASKIIIEPLEDGPPSMWGYRTDGPNAPALRTARCESIREALEQTLGLIRSTPEPVASKPKLELDERRLRICVNCVWHDLTDRQYEFLSTLFDAKGDWVSGKTFRFRADHVMKSLPPEVRAIVQSGRDGYRIPSLLQ